MQSSENQEPVREKDQRTGSFSRRRSVVIGLTGGVATGKSTVAAMFKELGAKVISADEIVRDLLRPGTSVWAAVVREFGEEIQLPDGNIDRRKLGDIVFGDPKQRAGLEAIVHPPVLERLRKEAEDFRKNGEGVLVLEVPLLVETGTTDMVDKVLVVTAEQDTQIKRLNYRYGVSREGALQRISSQMPLSDKEKFADWVISSEGTLEDTREQIIRVWYFIQKSLAQHK